MPNKMLFATIVAQFVKIWDKNSNYTGGAYNILNDKIQYFLDICYIVVIKQLQFHVVFLLILSSRVKNYFVLRIIKLLYNIVEAKNHWFAIYLDHYKEKLGIEMSSYDAFLLMTKDKGVNFGIIRFQTDDTLNIATKAFMNKEETKIIEAKFKAISEKILETGTSRDFNACCMTFEAKFIMVV